jgi:hypothetical protein
MKGFAPSVGIIPLSIAHIFHAIKAHNQANNNTSTADSNTSNDSTTIIESQHQASTKQPNKTSETSALDNDLHDSEHLLRISYCELYNEVIR